MHYELSPRQYRVRYMTDMRQKIGYREVMADK